MFLPLLIVLTLVKKGLGAVDFADPPSGSVIANFEGTVNATTIACNISNDGVQVSTQWNFIRSGSQGLIAISDRSHLFLITGDPDPLDTMFTFRNRLIILNFTSELDGTTVFCGTGAQPQLANFRLTLVTIPGQPGAPSADNVDATSISVHWNSPAVVKFPISYYLINASGLNSITVAGVVINTTTNITFFEVAGLLPGTTYELTIVAVSQVSDIIAKSQPSNPLTVITSVTAPALLCDTPVSANGAITVTWSYIHTGGLPLVNVSVAYTFNEGSKYPVSVSDLDTTSLEVSDLVAGFEYTFNIIAENSNGSSSILCGPTLHRIGRPATPMFGELMSGPGAGEVTIMIKTVASGLENPTQVFWFIITPYTDGSEGEATPHLIPNYQSGTFAMIIVGGLEEGERHRFNATATNTFGASEVATSNFIIAGVGLSTNIGAIVGGVVGGISILFISTLLAVLLLVIVLRLLQKRGKVVISQDETEPEYEMPDFSQPKPKGDVDIELTECPAYGRI